MTLIAAFGDIDIDLLLDVDDYPPPGAETFARGALTGLGGSAVNTAVWLVRLGFEASVLGQVGDDDFGHRATAALRSAGVDTSRVLVSDTHPTGLNILVVTPDGERTMIGVPGANRAYRGDARGTAVWDWLHLSAYALLEDPQRTSARTAIHTALWQGIPISIDIPSGVAKVLGSDLTETLAGSTIVSVGREPLTRITSGGADDLLSAGVETVAVTAGFQPFSVWRGGESITITPPRVESVDSTGAGDAFVAGLIAGTLAELDLGPTATLAATVGAAATQIRGAGKSIDVGHLLVPAAWPDADPAWVEAARRALPHE